MGGFGRPVVDAGLWKRARKAGIDVGVDASRLVELGLEVVLAIVETGRVPPCLEELLAATGRAPVARELQAIAKAARAATARN